MKKVRRKVVIRGNTGKRSYKCGREGEREREKGNLGRNGAKDWIPERIFFHTLMDPKTTK